MANKKTYFKPECYFAELHGSSLMITGSGGSGVVNLTSGDDGNANEGMSRGDDFWDE